MITFGGDDKRNMSESILKFLQNSYPLLRKIVIIGQSFNNPQRLKAAKDEKTEFIQNTCAERMKRIMLKSDIAISAGGQTLYELARIGVPTIGIGVAKNQRRNLDNWKKYGFLGFSGWHDNEHLMQELEKEINRLEKPDIRKNRSKSGRLAVDGCGQFRIVNAFLADYFKKTLHLRKAKIQDARDIFNLSNEKEVRKNSFNTQKINWNHHLKWFKEQLRSTNHVFFVTVVSDKIIAQTRFNINSDTKEALVNISLIKDLRGLGLSSVILDKSVRKILKERKNIRLIKGHIKANNTSSIKCFKQSNFRFLNSTKIKGYRVKRYVRKIGKSV